MKTVIYILIITTLLSSCSGNKFLNRKYTSGIWLNKTKEIKSHSSYIQDTVASEFIQKPLNEEEAICIYDSIDSKNSEKKDTVRITKAVIKYNVTPYSKIIKHNTIHSDTSLSYCSLNQGIELKSTQKNTTYQKKLIQTKKITTKKSESLWAFLFQGIGKAFVETIIIVSIIAILICLIELLFAPSILFWTILLSIGLIIGLIILLIQNGSSNTGNNNHTFNDTMTYIGSLAVEFALAIVLIR